MEQNSLFVVMGTSFLLSLAFLIIGALCKDKKTSDLFIVAAILFIVPVCMFALRWYMYEKYWANTQQFPYIPYSELELMQKANPQYAHLDQDEFTALVNQTKLEAEMEKMGPIEGPVLACACGVVVFAFIIRATVYLVCPTAV
jgi:apolipoprotein N-acyltransferase